MKITFLLSNPEHYTTTRLISASVNSIEDLGGVFTTNMFQTFSMEFGSIYVPRDGGKRVPLMEGMYDEFLDYVKQGFVSEVSTLIAMGETRGFLNLGHFHNDADGKQSLLAFVDLSVI